MPYEPSLNLLPIYLLQPIYYHIQNSVRSPSTQECFNKLGIKIIWKVFLKCTQVPGLIL